MVPRRLPNSFTCIQFIQSGYQSILPSTLQSALVPDCELFRQTPADWRTHGTEIIPAPTDRRQKNGVKRQ